MLVGAILVEFAGAVDSNNLGGIAVDVNKNAEQVFGVDYCLGNDAALTHGFDGFGGGEDCVDIRVGEAASSKLSGGVVGQDGV